MNCKRTIHLVFNAHIDPVWLWPWSAGLDEVLATCRTACDLLDEYPELVFSRGEAWVYQQIERLDRELFRRIRRHVRTGRWEIVGGWWIQPDCNLPSGFALERQIRLGKEYFLDRFGRFPKIAYNVDSFGHAATLPGYLRAAGQDRYVMMRPQEHELQLPARLFRWRGYAGGPEVVTFRIARAYTTRAISLDHVRAALTELPAGVEHTMCFVGVGDHGGGPTRKQIEWCREHRSAIDGCELVFSSPRRFFAAIRKNIPQLPVVTGELQMHAIGCYSVQRAVKTALRQAEHRLHQAELVSGRNRRHFAEAWQKVCFNQFHDTLGGTAIPSAYGQVDAQLGFAACVADEALQYALREKLRAVPDDPCQRLVLWNASEEAFADWVEVEPWLGYETWQPGDFQLVDEARRPVVVQLLQTEALVTGKNRLLFQTRIPACGLRVLRIQRGGTVPPGRGQGHAGGRQFPVPRLVLVNDPSDTWSHGLDRYGEKPVASARWERRVVVDRGPLMSSQIQSGIIGRSPLRAEWRRYAGEEFLELRLQVHWSEKHKILKLVVPLPAQPRGRIDGILGGHLGRPNDGRELPVRDWSLFGAGRDRLGILCPDVFAADATSRRVRLTLLRSALMAHHDPHPGQAARFRVSDQGIHEFRFRFYRGRAASRQRLESQSLMLQRPPLTADLTRGMPVRFRW